MALNLEEFISRFKKRAEAVKSRSIPPIGGDERTAFIKQAEIDYQDFMIISDSEIEVNDEYLILRYKLDK
ncbi:MAG: hypothetical protein O3A48_00310 [Actinomycetota bacterium]|nr:hypothetical protein [Actinomycetota bacterium]MDA3012972.1 hypothetical protein [Actinomycetota bacterium]